MSETYTQAEVDDLLSAERKASWEVVVAVGKKLKGKCTFQQGQRDGITRAANALVDREEARIHSNPQTPA